MLQQLINSLIDGLLLGFVYGVAAMGLTLIWGVMRVINLGHGATMALGMFITYLLFVRPGAQSLPGPWWWWWSCRCSSGF